MRLTRAWFHAADLLAWACLGLSVIEAIAVPFVAPIASAMARVPPSPVVIGLEALGSAMLAMGSFAFIRRRLVSLPLLVGPALAVIAFGNVVVGLAWLGIVVVVFAAPFLLAHHYFKVSGTTSPPQADCVS